MTREFKRTFFSSSLAVLLIITNLICIKYTNFAGYVLPVSFITYPLMSLAIVMLVDIYGRKTAKQAIISSFIIQALFLVLYLLITKLSNQSIFPDLAIEVNKVFEIDIVNIITSLCTFGILSFVVANLYEGFKLKGQRSIGSIISMFVFIVLYGAIYILITNYSLEFKVLIKLLYTHLLSSFLMTMVCYGLYYVLRDNEEYIQEEYSTVPDKSLKVMIEEKKESPKSKKKTYKRRNNKGKDNRKK